MLRSFFGTRVDQMAGSSGRRLRCKELRFRPCARFGVEALEERRLLANIIPSGVISSKPDGANFDYTITLSNSSSSNSSIGTFWYSWIPGQDYLATSPVSVSPPTGWTDSVTNMGAGDGYAILFISNSSAYNVPAGSSLDFAFTSADTPASVNGNSVFYPDTPVGTSYVYPQGPFSDGGHVFVVAPALDSIAVTPANPSVTKGATEQFSATGTFDGGSTQDLTNQVRWASATTSVATISNASGSQGLATAVSSGTSAISASLDGVTGSTTLTVTAPTLKSITVTPANTDLPVGETEQFTATGTLSDNSTEDLTSQATWTSSDTTWATISNTGLATAVSPGPVTISAAFDGITGSTSLTITNAVLQSIAVTPANTDLPVGETEQFTATGTLSDNSTEDLTSQATWKSSDTTWATISNTGLATAISPGPVTISAAFDGITGSTALTITNAVLQSIAVTPANTNLPVGETEQFTATGTLSDKSTEDLTNQATWKSSDTTWATINNTGLATAISPGPVTISAAFDGITGSTALTITNAVLQSIALTPANPSIAAGDTEQFTATGTFSDNSTENLTGQVTWASATTSVATISNASGSQGLATGVKAGTSSISAALDGVTGSTVLTVTAATLQSIAVNPANPSVSAGGTEQFTATGTYSDKSTQDLTSQVTWASATTSVATISNASGSQGLATGVKAGTSSISAALDGVTGSTVLTVTSATLVSIAVTPANTDLPAGETEQFTATGTLSDNSTEDLTSQATWTSSDTTWATISNTGLATAVSPGPVTISAAFDGITGSTGLTITNAVLQSISLAPTNPSIAAGDTEQFTATGTYSDKSTQNLISQVTWASATTSVATISNASGSQGLATGVEAGTSSISAALDGVTGLTVLTVTSLATVSGVSVSWGASGTVALQTAADGLRLLPAGRNTDLPWMGINAVSLTLSSSTTLTSADVTLGSAAGINYGPITLSGSGTNYVVTLAQPISTADRLTISIASSSMATYTRRLDVLPGDANDDGFVNTTDGLLILYNETPAHAYQMFYDLNGDGAVTMADFNLLRPKIGTVLPAAQPVVSSASTIGPVVRSVGSGGSTVAPASPSAAVSTGLVDLALGSLAQGDSAEGSTATIAVQTTKGGGRTHKPSTSRHRPSDVASKGRDRIEHKALGVARHAHGQRSVHPSDRR